MTVLLHVISVGGGYQEMTCFTTFITLPDAQGIVQPTFAILTTEANTLVSQIHTRMPVILREQDEENWLNPRLSLDEAQALLVPLPAELLMMYEVSPKVNSPAYNTPEALQPVA